MKFSAIVEGLLEQVHMELKKPHNQHKMNSYIVEPITKEISSKLQPVIYLILILYLMLFIPIVLVSVFVVLKRSPSRH